MDSSIKCLLVCICILIFSTNFIVQTTELNKPEGDSCIFSDSNIGECRALSSCQAVLENISTEDPVICSFETEAIVCCPIPKTTPLPTTHRTVTTKVNTYEPPDEIKKTKSYQKCVEYAEAAYYWQKSPIPNEPPVKVSQCGFEVKPLIVGGEPAALKEFPHMVAIGYNTKEDPIWECGGTLISDQFVLTAAHCEKSRKTFAGPVVLRTGIVNLVNENTFSSLQEYTPAEFIKHPDYKYTKYDDIALIKLNRPVEFTAFVRPACLHVQRVIEAKAAYATGWGLNSTNALEGTDELMKVKLTLISPEVCNNTFGKYTNRKLKKGIVEDIHLCAGDIDKDTCQGDSGGPLQIFRKDVFCMYDVIGVTSFGGICGSTHGVYTRVSNYISWIEIVVWP